MLADDGRTAPADPMRLFWFPAPCVDPPGGQHYNCYPFFDTLPTGVDRTPVLHEVPVTKAETTITIPPNALAKALARPGVKEPFATAYVFMVACAGHVERIHLRSGLGPNQLPIACFDAKGDELDPDAFVFGFTRVFVFETRRNAIPSFDAVTFQGASIDPAKGVVTGKCVRDNRGNCNTVKLDVTYPDSSSEIDPDNVDAHGHVGRETLYVDWFSTVGWIPWARATCSRRRRQRRAASPPTQRPSPRSWRLAARSRRSG
jgi:hypothetical protein